MRNLILSAIFIAFLSFAAAAQSVCPPDLVCLSHAAANQSAANERELIATKAKNVVLTDALAEKDRIAESIKQTARQNEADLRAALTKTQVELAAKTGELIGSEANNTRNLAVIDLLLKSVRPKKIGLINF